LPECAAVNGGTHAVITTIATRARDSNEASISPPIGIDPAALKSRNFEGFGLFATGFFGRNTLQAASSGWHAEVWDPTILVIDKMSKGKFIVHRPSGRPARQSLSTAWTKYKIEVQGRKARLYVHGAEQPSLVVNDMKLEPKEGGVALWVGPGTEGYFSNLKIAAK
jgi:hypothetical protein